MAKACPASRGSMTEGLFPSLEQPKPRITANTRSPAASASESRLSATKPAPSPNTTPSAATSKGRLPRADRPRNCANRLALGAPGVNTPPARDRSHSCARRLLTPATIAYSDDAQAASKASTFKPGPISRSPTAL